MTEIIPGIERLKIPLPSAKSLLGYVNIYLVKGNDGYLLIDTGWGMIEAFNSLEKQLAERGIDFKDISQIVCTHIHPDHYGLSGKLKQLSGAKVILHRLETNMVDSRYVNMDSLMEDLARWLHVNGVPEDKLPKLKVASLEAAAFVSVTMPDIVLHGGETITTGLFTFEALWTPGHSPGHICLYEPNHKLLISGDHVLHTISSHIGLHPQAGDNPLGDFIASLNELKTLDVNLILPGHEEPFSGLKERIEELIRHHEERKAEIRQIIKAETGTAYDIASRIIWLMDVTPNGVRLQNLYPLDQRLAVLETMAHLELMRIDGEIKKSNRDGVICYSM